jgi:hypothetical protein
MNTVRGYREKAAQARRSAKLALNAAAREQLEMAARDYDQMADQLIFGLGRENQNPASPSSRRRA